MKDTQNHLPVKFQKNISSAKILSIFFVSCFGLTLESSWDSLIGFLHTRLLRM